MTKSKQEAGNLLKRVRDWDSTLVLLLLFYPLRNIAVISDYCLLRRHAPLVWGAEMMNGWSTHPRSFPVCFERPECH